MNTEALINKFYTSFVNGDAKGMTDCYHDDVVFQDPAFGRLKGNRAKKMWEMLLSQKAAAPTITFNNVNADADNGTADWTATYFYGPKKRKVFNQVHASFTIKDGKIIKHVDDFNIWKWTQQALGPVGYVLGWTSFMQKKIQTLANGRLDAFIKKSS